MPLSIDCLATARDEGRRPSWQLANAMLPGLMKEADLGGLTGAQYLARLAAEAVPVINARDYARVISEHADRRSIIRAAECAATQAATGTVSPANLAVDCMADFDAIATRYSAEHTASVSFEKASERSIERMQAAMQRGGAMTGITTGLPDLDRKINGWQRGDFILLAGRPGMGKSGLTISSLRQSAAAGFNALLFSLEMSAENVTDRMLSDACFNMRAPIPYFDIARGGVTNEQAEKIIDAKRSLRQLPIKIDPQGGLTVAQIAARARRHKQQLERQGKTLDLVAVDHLHIVKPSGRYSGNRVNEITEISGALKPLAKELNVPLVVLAQLSRQVEGREEKRPMLSDLRDSGSLEQDADIIIFLYREAYYLQGALGDPAKDHARIARLAEIQNTLEANIAKQRNGPTGTVELFFNPASNAARGMSLIELERAVA